MLVLDSGVGQRSLQLLPVKVRVTSGPGKAPHINQDLDLERSERLDQIFERTGRVTHGPDFEFVFDHDKFNGPVALSDDLTDGILLRKHRFF
jgi:hypothetical protein